MRGAPSPRGTGPEWVRQFECGGRSGAGLISNHRQRRRGTRAREPRVAAHPPNPAQNISVMSSGATRQLIEIVSIELSRTSVGSSAVAIRSAGAWGTRRGAAGGDSDALGGQSTEQRRAQGLARPPPHAPSRLWHRTPPGSVQGRKPHAPREPRPLRSGPVTSTTVPLPNSSLACTGPSSSTYAASVGG